MAVKIQVKVFWVVTCNVSVGDQHFGGPHCLRLQDKDGGSTSNRGAIVAPILQLQSHHVSIMCSRKLKSTKVGVAFGGMFS
jgi:hypothetical protein